MKTKTNTVNLQGIKIKKILPSTSVQEQVLQVII